LGEAPSDLSSKTSGFEQAESRHTTTNAVVFDERGNACSMLELVDGSLVVSKKKRNESNLAG
jgi:hypothetical protein